MYFLYAGMPEWSNGTDSKSVGLVPTKVRILLPAFILKNYFLPFE